jgi:hypothetical protein
MGAEDERKEDLRMITGASTYVTDIALLLRMPPGARGSWGHKKLRRSVSRDPGGREEVVPAAASLDPR